MRLILQKFDDKCVQVCFVRRKLNGNSTIPETVDDRLGHKRDTFFMIS